MPIAFQRFENDSQTSDHQKVARAIFDLVRDHGTALAEETYAGLTGYTMSPVSHAVYSAEALYAAQFGLTGEAKTAVQILCGRLAQFCVENSFNVIGQTERGPKIMMALRRDLGDETVTQELADDPPTMAQFRPA